MAELRFDNVWQQYGRQIVLERINLTVRSGEFVSLVGASGCGKSTFLRMLLGQETPSKGRIMLDGEPLRAEPDRSRGVVFQRYSVYPHLTVAANILIGLELAAAPFSGRLFGQRRKTALLEVDTLIEAVGLEASREKYPAALSGGMQQRLALAQALVTKPRVLLLDEPFGALDPGTRVDMHRLLRGLWEARGMTVFMVTHDLHEGFSLGTRLLTFDKPRVDPHSPERYGATITYDIPLLRGRQADRSADARPLKLSGTLLMEPESSAA